LYGGDASIIICFPPVVNKQKKWQLPQGELPWEPSAAAAAAEDQKRDDNQPDPVVVKEIAQAVAVHNENLRKSRFFGRDFPSALSSYVAAPQMFPLCVKKTRSSARGEACLCLFHKKISKYL
jgi:hypothetical protein